MRIRSISLRRFKKYNEFDEEFSPGFNVIKGPNESGKSTLVEAISTILYEKAKSRKASVRNLATWGQESLPMGAIELEKDGKHYHVIKDINGKQQSISVIGGGRTKESWNTESSVDEQIENLVGIGNRDLFESVSCVRQNEMDFSKKSDILAKSLQRVVTGVQVDSTASDAIIKINKKIMDTNKGRERHAMHPGIIKELEDGMEALSSRIDEIKDTVTDTESAREELIKTETRLREITEEVEMAQKLLETNKDYRKITERKGELTGKLKELSARIDRIKERQGKLDDLSRKISARNNISKIIEEEVDQQIQKIDNEIEIKKKYTSRLGAQEFQSQTPPSPTKQKGINFLPSVLIAVIGVILGTLLFAVQPVLGVIVIVGMLALAGVVYYIRGRKIPQEVEVISVQPSPPLVDMSAEISTLKHQRNVLLTSRGFSSINEMRTAISEYKGLVKERDKLGFEINGELGGEILTRMEERQRSIVNEIAVESQKIPSEMEEKILTPKEYSDLEIKTEADQKTLEELKDKQRELRAQLKTAGATREDLYSLEEQKIEYEEHLKREMEKLMVLTIALQWLDIAKEKTMQPAASLLERKLGNTIARITDNKYKKVKVDRDTLDISILDDDRVIPVNGLSTGTIDQVYISARIGLHKIITRDSNPPLILDEPFVNFDKERHDNIKRMLKEISRENQILLFSHTDEYDDIADKVIELA